MRYSFSEDWFSPGIAQWEKFLSKLSGTPCQLLEIGSFEGRSAMWMADKLMSHPDSRLFYIDSWIVNTWYPDAENNFDKNLYNNERKHQITKIRSNSDNALRNTLHSWDASFDFAYIDGSHEARDVITDWVFVLPLMKQGGIICFDDYLWTTPGNWVQQLPGPAIDAILKFWDAKINLMYKDYQVWVQVK